MIKCFHLAISIYDLNSWPYVYKPNYGQHLILRDESCSEFKLKDLAAEERDDSQNEHHHAGRERSRSAVFLLNTVQLASIEVVTGHVRTSHGKFWKEYDWLIELEDPSVEVARIPQKTVCRPTGVCACSLKTKVKLVDNLNRLTGCWNGWDWTPILGRALGTWRVALPSLLPR